MVSIDEYDAMQRMEDFFEMNEKQKELVKEKIDRIFYDCMQDPLNEALNEFCYEMAASFNLEEKD